MYKCGGKNVLKSNGWSMVQNPASRSSKITENFCWVSNMTIMVTLAGIVPKEQYYPI